MKYLLTVSYNGKDYCGWQVQPKVDTVQKRLTHASETIFGMPCKITGCSRTDSGVHALDFKASLEPIGNCPPKIPVDRLPMALNTCLPADISVIRAKRISKSFHPRYDVKKKEYLYRICTSKLRDPFEQDRAYHYPKALNIDKMREAAKYICGRHDFSSFMASGSDVTDTVRTVFSVKITKKGTITELRIVGDGFLYNMVRIIVGTLLAVSEGSIAPGEINDIIESRCREKAGMTAPACGLYLSKVYY